MIWYNPELNELFIAELSTVHVSDDRTQISFLFRFDISEEDLMSVGWHYVGTL